MYYLFEFKRAWSGMQNLPLYFDVLVLGNEPGGLWFLREFERLKNHTAAKLGWLKIDAPILEIPLPISISSHYRINTGTTYSAEIVTKSRLLQWSPEKVFDRFKSLERSLGEKTTDPTLAELRSIKEAVLRNPELITLSQALWKRLGRCREIPEPQMVWAALKALQLTDWTPEALISEISNLTTYLMREGDFLKSVEETDHPEPNQKGKIFKLSLESGKVLFSKLIILNFTAVQLRQFVTNSVVGEWALCPDDLLSRFSNYPLTLKFGHYHLPKNIQPLTLLLEQDVLPEPDLEMWPMSLSSNDLNQSVTLWVTDRTDFSFEVFTEKVKKALARFQYHFPTALNHTVSQSIPLGVDICYSEEQRVRVIKAIENSRQELYSISLLNVRTRKKGIYSLLPALQCTLPYPLGTLRGAEEILKELFSRKDRETNQTLDNLKTLTSP